MYKPKKLTFSDFSDMFSIPYPVAVSRVHSSVKPIALCLHCDTVMYVCRSANTPLFLQYEQMPIPLISNPKVFAIDTVYQSRKIYPLPSVPSPANSCLPAGAQD